MEQVLCRHPAVREVAIVVVPHPKWGEVLKVELRRQYGGRASPVVR